MLKWQFNSSTTLRKGHDTIFKSVLLSSLNTARAGEVVLASHSLTVPSAEQERRRWCALLYTKPQTESVCPHIAPRSIDGSATQKTQVRYHDSIWKSTNSNKTHDAVTVGVVGVDVGVGGVPALDSPVNPSTETLLPCAAHYHAQHSPSGSNSDELLKRLVDLTLKLKHFFLICFVFTCEPWKCRSVPHLKQHSCGQTI